MALNIAHNCKTQGMTLAAMYVRITAEVNSAGDKVKVKADWYNDKPAYTASIYNMLPVEVTYTYPDLSTVDLKIENVKEFTYDRTTDGTDILQFAHDQYSAYLQELPEDKNVDEGEDPIVNTDPLIPVADISENDLI